MMLRLTLALAFLAATSCGDFPRDPEKTLEKIRSERSFKVGLIAPLGDGGVPPTAQALLQRVGHASGATPQLERGDAEPLLSRLEDGDLDLVVGRFEAASPWARLVTFSPPLGLEVHGQREFHLVAAMRNGENAWIGLVEREARNIGAGAQ